MHESGTIYRSNRLVNWSCALRSAISDIEVEKKELAGRTLIDAPGYEHKVEFGVLTSFAYKLRGEEGEIVVSTTRVETMFGDTAVAVHPDDLRYRHLIWQAVRFTLMQLGSDYRAKPFAITGKESIMDKWILSRAAYAVSRCNTDMDTYNFTQYTTTLYDFWLYDLCDIYLESVKPVISSGTEEARERAKAALYHCVETGLRLISPVMPFLSEELWQHLPRLSNHPPSIVVHAYPEPSEYPFNDEQVEADVAFAMSVVRTVRSLRSDYELSRKTKTDCWFLPLVCSYLLFLFNIFFSVCFCRK
ncbi:Anticodon-binding domain protein [Oesophagostomum dentatum]|uniref:valine--tRNA ligase n=1 Tax=Oesophagostomum dentatum TaxID=61180 RepID=A0A0B1SU14_OESDE|nr:Anticodon-binding domain protein [Oesophagostomum dentatum]